MIIKLNNKKFSGFSSYTINLKFNAIASSFSFEAKAEFIKELLQYPRCEIEDPVHGKLITGVILAPRLRSSPEPQATSVSGYSITGVLEDCSIPISLFPLQSDKLNLSQITEKILNPFGIGFVVDRSKIPDAFAPIEKSTAEPGQSVKEYLTKLASQRGIILTSNRFGNLVYTKIDATNSKPVATFKVGSYGVKGMEVTIDAQKMHSEITVMKQASSDNPDAGQFTIANPYVPVFRPMVKIVDSGTIFDVKKAARFELSNELSAIKLTFNTTKFIYPGQVILVENSELRINKLTEWFVENTVIKGNEKENDRYTLTCVLKDVYTTDQVITNIFE
jgi:prophage tail gpP-like protein